MSEPDRAWFQHITTHEADGLALFARQFANAARVRALARAHLTQLQELEDAAWAVFTAGLDTATGDALDQYGRLLVFPRGALDDTCYRAILRGVVRARRGSGTSEDLLQTAALALGAVTFEYIEGSASECVVTQSPITFAAALLLVLRLAKPGGVALQVVSPARTLTSTFRFADGLQLQSSALVGLGDTGQTVGGHLAGVVA
jgi:hypothetical protein